MLTKFAMMILLMFRCFEAQAQSQTLTLAHQTDDFTVFRGALQEGHGGLYYFIDRAAFSRKCDSVAETFREQAPVEAYYLKLRYLLTLLRHGHSRISLSGEGEPNFKLNILKKDRRYLPLQLMVINQKVYVLGDCSDEQVVQKGTEIVGINGRLTRQLVDSMGHYIPADGINTTFKAYNLYNYYNFHFLYSLFYPSETEFVLALAGQPKSVRVQAQTPSAMEKVYKASTGKSLSYFNNPTQYNPTVATKTAYLKIGSFYKGFIENFGVRYESFVDSAFRDMNSRGTQNLIIDIRDNEGGGDSYSEILFSHITPNPVVPNQLTVPGKMFPFQRYTVDLSDDVKSYIANPAEFLEGDGTLKLKQKYLDMMGTTIPPAKDRFSGRIFVLINGGSFSASSYFINYLYTYRQTTKQPILFVGEENGGDIYANVLCAGQGYRVKLPNSDIKVDMPFLCTGELSKKYPDKRLPDYPVSPTITGLLQGQDEAMLFVLTQINGK